MTTKGECHQGVSNLNNLEITTLYGNLKEHEQKITRFKVSEESVQKKEKKSIVLKDTSSKVTSWVQEDIDSNEDSPSEDELRLFVTRYKRYVKKNGLKYSDKILINFMNASLKQG